jgi:hypothetical protein
MPACNIEILFYYWLWVGGGLPPDGGSIWRITTDPTTPPTSGIYWVLYNETREIVGPDDPVYRYWVGGTGNISDPNHWSTTPFGPGGATPPITFDRSYVAFLSGSDSAGQVITFDVDVSTFAMLTPAAEDVGDYPNVINFNGKNVRAQWGISLNSDCVSEILLGAAKINTGRWTIYGGIPVTAGTSTIRIIDTLGRKFEDNGANVYNEVIFDFDYYFPEIEARYGRYERGDYITMSLTYSQGMTISSLSVVPYKRVGGCTGVINAGVNGSVPGLILSCGEFALSGSIEHDFVLGLGPHAETEPFVVSKSSGTVEIENTELYYCEAVGGATFNAFTSMRNVDAGGNSGWLFSDTRANSGEFAQAHTEMDVTNMDGVNTDAMAQDLWDTNIEKIQGAISTVTDDVDGLIDAFASTASASDLMEWQMPNLDIAVSFELAETVSASISGVNAIEEFMFIYEAIQHGWHLSAADNLALADALSEVLCLLISDWITLIDSQTNNWNGSDVISDNLFLYDIAAQHQRIALTISESVDMADTSILRLTVAVLEYLGFTEIAQGLKTMASSISESLNLLDNSDGAYPALIEEVLSVIDSTSVLATFLHAISESIGLADAPSTIKKVYPSIQESVSFSETVTSQGTLYNALYETLRMDVAVELDGQIFECYVLNTPKFMASMYSGYNFNSYCVFEDRAFAANSTGIYELAGDTDAGSDIHTGMVTDETDFGSRNQKRFRRGYLGIEGTTPVMVLETDDGRQAYTIDFNGKAVFSHEQKSKTWKLAVADFDTLSSIKLIPIILSK